ncbi:MAG: hypothetical protein QW802_01780 [Candidatus Altiarchaeota archaeon]
MFTPEFLLRNFVYELRIFTWNVFQLFVAVVVGLILGWLVSKVVNRLLKLAELQRTLLRYGAITTIFWDSAVGFLSHYFMWLTLILIIYAVFPGNLLIKALAEFFVKLFGFIIFTLVGILLSGVLYKISKHTLIAIGLEEELEKHKIADKLGGVSLINILAGILKWFVIIVFVKQGVELLGLGALTDVTHQLYNYIPQAILGILILLATLILADLASSNIRKRAYGFADALGMATEVVIIFFGIIIALPRLLGVSDPQGQIFLQSISVMTDSFKLLMLGVSAGIALAIGLGLKDYVAKMSKKL